MTVRHRMAGLALAFAGAWALTIPHATVVRAEDGGGRLSFGDDVVIEAGETVSGNVVLMGADLTVEPGATVDGDVAVTFGDAAIDGKVTGQVFVAGDLALGPTAEIGGDVVVLGQDTIADAALVHGRVSRGGDRLGVGEARETPPAAGPSSLSRLGRVLASTALAMLIAALVVTVAPVAVSRVATAMTTRSAASFGVGCLAWVLFLPLAVALTITVVGVLALGLFYFLALLVGAVAVAEIFGAAVAPGARRASRAALGAAALGLALNVGTTEHLGLLCASVAVAVLASVWPLGAGILTLVGTRPWPPEDAQPPQEGGEAPSPWAPTRQAKAVPAAAEEPSAAEEAPPTVPRTPGASASPAATAALPAPEAPAPDLSGSPDASAEGEGKHAPVPEEGAPAQGAAQGRVEAARAPPPLLWEVRLSW